MAARSRPGRADATSQLQDAATSQPSADSNSDSAGAAAALHAAYADATILFVEDEPVSQHLLQYVLGSAGYKDVHAAGDIATATALFASVRPDIVLTDLGLPDGDGMTLVRTLHDSLAPGEYLPIVVITADMSTSVRQQALASGALDFVTKPYDHEEVLLRIRNLLQTRMLYREVQQKARQLSDVLRVRTDELDEARLEVLQRLARAADFRDDATGEHSRRVGRNAARIARQLGLDEATAESIGQAAMLHDIGKIGIPDGILLKPDSLTPEELAVVRRHTDIGREILSGSASPLLQFAATIAYTHHERWDGKGYHGLVGEDIPLPGRIVTVADSYDVMINDRPYHQGMPPDQALGILRRNSGSQFDARVVEAFLTVINNGAAE